MCATCGHKGYHRSVKALGTRWNWSKGALQRSQTSGVGRFAVPRQDNQCSWTSQKLRRRREPLELLHSELT